jgi:hypothetical protein
MKFLEESSVHFVQDRVKIPHPGSIIMKTSRSQGERYSNFYLEFFSLPFLSKS